MLCWGWVHWVGAGPKANGSKFSHGGVWIRAANRIESRLRCSSLEHGRTMPSANAVRQCRPTEHFSAQQAIWTRPTEHFSAQQAIRTRPTEHFSAQQAIECVHARDRGSPLSAHSKSPDFARTEIATELAQRLAQLRRQAGQEAPSPDFWASSVGAGQAPSPDFARTEIESPDFARAEVIRAGTAVGREGCLTRETQKGEGPVGLQRLAQLRRPRRPDAVVCHRGSGGRDEMVEEDGRGLGGREGEECAPTLWSALDSATPRFGVSIRRGTLGEGVGWCT